MAEYLQKILGGAKSIASPVPSADVDADFADFADAASPVAVPNAETATFANTEASSTAAAAAGSAIFGSPMSTVGRPYTKWYRVWERVTLADFYQELFIIPLVLLVVVVNLWGTSANRARAQTWAKKHYPLLEEEFAQVGLYKSRGGGRQDGEKILKEKTKAEYVTYATGRKNVACLDVKISLVARYNPFSWFGDLLISFFVDTWPAPTERVEATLHCFDGKEKLLIAAQADKEKAGGSSGSAFDGFVFAVVHKDQMKKLRDDRYDLSLTTTKDHPKLPAWSTVMSESAEVTEAVLTSELIKAITEVGDDFESLIISDQPIDAPKKLAELVPKKRVYLSTKLSTSQASTSLFALFLRIPDHLVSTAHFRPEAIRRIKTTREEEQRKLRKIDEEEKAEERKLAADKLKKEERERKLSKMNDAEQRKFLEKEREKNSKKGQKRMSVRG